MPDNLKDEKEVTDFLDQIPLFSHTMQEEGTNEFFDAMHALIAEATPEDRAMEYKESGNSCYKAGKERYDDAVSYYSLGIDLQCEDQTLNATLYSNRAQVYSLTGNHGKAVQDCQEAVSRNPNNVKAYFRLARSARALRKYKLAIDNATKGLKIPGAKPAERDALEKELAESQRLFDEAEIKRREREEEEEKERSRRSEVVEMAKKRGYKLGFDYVHLKSEESERAVITLDANQALHFPVVFLYPQYNQSDFIQAFCEQHRFSDHLQMMFPPSGMAAPWDEKNEYLSHSVDIYREVKGKKGETKLQHVKPNSSLGAVLSKGGDVALASIFFVVPKNSSFTKQWLSQYGK